MKRVFLGAGLRFSGAGRLPAGLTALLLCPLLAFAEPAAAQSLPEALAATYESNPTLRAARAELRAVNEGVPQALSNWRPELSASGSIGKRRTETQQPSDNTSATTPREASLLLIQPLYRGGRTVAGTERAESEVLAQRAVLQTVEQSVLLEGAVSYFDVWRDQSVLELNINNEQVLRRQLEATEDRFEVGEVTRTDVAQAESRLANATSNRIAAEGDLAASRAVFERVVGRAPENLARPDPVAGLPAGREESIELSVKDDPRVVAALLTERAAARSVREVEGELLPEVNLRGTLSHQEDNSTSGSESQSASIIAEVRIPIYQQGQVSSRVRQAKQIANQRRIEIDESRRLAKEDAIQAWEDLLTARAQIESFETSVRANEIALEGVRQENEVGARTILDILDAEQELLDAQVSLVGAERDNFSAGFALLSAIGRLTALDLDLPVDLYDADLDYKAVRNSWFGLTEPGEK